MTTGHFINNFDPIAFRFGFFVMPWYWLVYLIGYFWVFFSLAYFSRKGLCNLTKKQIYLFMTRGFFFMLLGARLTYIFLYNYSYYQASPLKVLYIWEGGMSFHGGLMAVILVIVYYKKKFNLSFFDFSDPVSVAIPIVLGFGRIANFLNGELAGRVTTSSFGVIFPRFYDERPRHPSQLYEAFFEGFILFAILWLTKKSLKVKAKQSALFLIFYGVFRFFIEYFRLPDKQLGTIFLSLSMGQILCFFMIVTGFCLYPRKNTIFWPFRS